MKRLVCLILPLVLHTIKLFAAVDTLNLSHFNLDNGFPSNNVYSLLQDRHGYLWFATDNGVVKYNGYSFKIFNTSNGLPSNDVWQLFEDFKGRIWLTSYTHKIGYLENDRYKDIGFSVGNKAWGRNIRDNGKIVSFTIEIGGKTNIVVLYNEKVFLLPLSMFDKIPQKAVYWLGRNSFYRIDEALDVHRFDFGRGKTPSVIFRGYGNKNLGKVSMGANDDVYVKQFASDCIRYINLRNGASKNICLTDCGARNNEQIYVGDHRLDGGGEKKTFFITDSKIYFFDSLFNFHNSELISDLIPSKAQAAYHYADDLGNRWITTAGDGVWKIPAKPRFFKKTQLTSLLQGSMYLGAVDSALFWWDKDKTRLLKVYNGEVVATINLRKGDRVGKVVGDSKSLYLVLNTKVYVYDNRSGSLRELINAKDKHSIHNLSYIEKNSTIDKFNSANEIALVDNKLYSAGQQLLLCYSMYSDPDSFSIDRMDNERFETMYIDSSRKKIWIYNTQKILIVDPLNGTRITLGTGELQTLGIGNVKHLETDNEGQVYVQTDNDIFVYTPSLNVLRKLDLNINVTGGIFRIYNGKIFFADRFGLASAKISGSKMKDLRVVANEDANYYNKVYNLAFDPGGNFFLVTDKGLYSNHADSLNSGHTIAVDSMFSMTVQMPYTKNIKDRDTFYFEQGERKLNVDVINLYGSGTPEYTYTISNGSSIINGTGEIFIEALDPGVYYQVRCVIKDKLWKSNPLVFYVYRQPYWWQTSHWKLIFWVSGSISLVGLILIIVLVTRYFVAKKNAKRRAQTELELRAIHSQINPHFIFNTLSTALYFINKKRFDDAYIHVNKFSRLLRSYLKASQDRYTIVGDEIQMLRNYIELQQTRFEQKFIYKIEIDNKIPVNNIQIPSLLLQPLIENAINHGLFHRESGGELIIKFLQGVDNTELICVIEDNGVGRAKAREINEASSTKDSYGTKLTNQLLEVFKEYEHMNIFMEYTDKREPETGTIVTLTLKNIKYVA